MYQPPLFLLYSKHFSTRSHCVAWVCAFVCFGYVRYDRLHGVKENRKKNQPNSATVDDDNETFMEREAKHMAKQSTISAFCFMLDTLSIHSFSFIEWDISDSVNTLAYNMQSEMVTCCAFVSLSPHSWHTNEYHETISSLWTIPLLLYSFAWVIVVECLIVEQLLLIAVFWS